MNNEANKKEGKMNMEYEGIGFTVGVISAYTVEHITYNLNGLYLAVLCAISRFSFLEVLQND